MNNNQKKQKPSQLGSQGKITREPKGFNTVESCPNCNPCLCPADKEKCNAIINRHEFMNPYEFADKALLEELIIRIKKGCIRIKKDKEGWYWFEDKCRWDLARGMKKDKKTGKIVKDKNAEENYAVPLQYLLDTQNKYRKLEDEDKLCSFCLERETSPDSILPTICCVPCGEREEKSRESRGKCVRKEKS